MKASLWVGGISAALIVAAVVYYAFKWHSWTERRHEIVKRTEVLADKRVRLELALEALGEHREAEIERLKVRIFEVRAEQGMMAILLERLLDEGWFP